MACWLGRLLPTRLREMASKMVPTTAQPLLYVASSGCLTFVTGQLLKLRVPGDGKKLQRLS